jgi:cation-transporting ATPase 13A2
MATVSFIQFIDSPVTEHDSGVERESTELVPGDIIKLSQSQSNFFPADMFLLSGDTIVNESMLTGESVPVSKIPIRDEDLMQWKDSKDVHGESAKSFLYAGTKVVRIRGALAADGSMGRPALALVVRTGKRSRDSA